MIDSVLTACAILISSVVAVIGYGLNARAARELERSKVYRLAKMDAYREMNATIAEVDLVYESRRQLLATLRRLGPSDPIVPTIMEHVSYLRDSEKGLGTNIAERVVEKYDEFIDGHDPGQKEETQEEPEHDFAKYAALSSVILSQRVLFRDFMRMEVARANACLVSGDPGRLRTALQNLADHFTDQWDRTEDAIAAEIDRHKAGKEASPSEPYGPDMEFQRKIAEILKMMRDDLDETMTSRWVLWSQKRPQCRAQIGGNGVSSSTLALSQIAIALLVAGYSVIFGVLIAKGFALGSVYLGGVILIVAGGYTAVRALQHQESSNASNKMPTPKPMAVPAPLRNPATQSPETKSSTVRFHPILSGERGTVVTLWATFFITVYIATIAGYSPSDSWPVALIILGSASGSAVTTLLLVRLITTADMYRVIDWVLGKTKMDKGIAVRLGALAMAAVIAALLYGLIGSLF